MIDTESQQLFDQFIALSLPKSEWTHRAHLVVCWVALSTHSTDETIDFLRDAIRTYNTATGVENTPTSGYHETLTQYFVRAVASLNARSIDKVAAATATEVGAPQRHWSRELLFNVEARARWTEPDLVPLAPAPR